MLYSSISRSSNSVHLQKDGTTNGMISGQARMQEFYRFSPTECDIYIDLGQAPDKCFYLAETTERNISVSAQKQVLRTLSMGKTENIFASTAETCGPRLLVNVSINLATLQRRGKEIYPLNERLRYDSIDGNVIRIFCALCSKHQKRLRCLLNYNSSFIQGIFGLPLIKTV